MGNFFTVPWSDKKIPCCHCHTAQKESGLHIFSAPDFCGHCCSICTIVTRLIQTHGFFFFSMKIEDRKLKILFVHLNMPFWTDSSPYNFFLGGGGCLLSDSEFLVCFYTSCRFSFSKQSMHWFCCCNETRSNMNRLSGALADCFQIFF